MRSTNRRRKARKKGSVRELEPSRKNIERESLRVVRVHASCILFEFLVVLYLKICFALNRWVGKGVYLVLL